jgi:hypothetical protein
VKPWRAAALAMLATFFALGCAETVVRSGLPAGDPAKGYDRRWDDAFVLGTVRPGAPTPLATVCPQGWSEIRVTPTFPAALVGWATFGIYTPSVVTVLCASSPGVFVGAPGEMPLPPMCR